MTPQRLRINVVSNAYWRITFDNLPINLYDPEMFAELRQLSSRISHSSDLKVIVFDSADPLYFLAHYDVLRGDIIPDMPAAAPFTEWPAFVSGMVDSPVVSIALIRGRTRGHGSELALACDMRFASIERAVFAQVEMGLGVVPGGGAMDWLPRTVGRSRSLEIILGADDFDAATAERYGWINRALPDQDLDEFVDRLAQRIAGFNQDTLRLAKRTINLRSLRASSDELWNSNQLFLASASWPSTRPIIEQAMALGLQQRSDFELYLGSRLDELS